MAVKLGIHSMEMGPKENVEGAFEDQQVLVTPLIGKLCMHVEYVNHEGFYVSPLKHADVLLGALWFTCMLATLRDPDRVIMFKHRGRDIITYAIDNKTLFHLYPMNLLVKQ